MGIGHTRKAKQLTFLKSKGLHQFCHGGRHRQIRKGRGARPLSTKESVHVVFKIHKSKLRQLSLRSHQTFAVVQRIIQTYAQRFFIKIEHISIQNDHIHILIRTSRRSLFHYFFRVVAGQIAQQLKKEGLLSTKRVTGTPRSHRAKAEADESMKESLWMYRPFSRVVRGYKTYFKMKDYIQLNEKESGGEIKYSKLRLRGLSMADWKILWS